MKGKSLANRDTRGLWRSLLWLGLLVCARRASLELEGNDLIKSITSDKSIRPVEFTSKVKLDCKSPFGSSAPPDGRADDRALA